MIVTLKLHQVQYIMDGTLPTDLTPSLVFEASGVVRLQHRIKDLDHEKSLQKKQQKLVILCCIDVLHKRLICEIIGASHAIEVEYLKEGGCRLMNL